MSNRTKLSDVKRTLPLILDYNEVADDLVAVMERHKKMVDFSIYETIVAEPELIAFILSDEFEATVVYNCMSSDFGKGILVGLVAEAIGTYYAQLEAQLASGESEESGGDGHADDDYV